MPHEMRQTAKHPIFYMFSDEPKMQILFSSVSKGYVLVKHNIHHELKLTIMDLNLQITRKHPVDILHSTHKIFLFSSKYFYVTKKYDTYL